MYLVQSVIFDKSKFSLEDARRWLLSNKYKDKGVDEKKHFWRFRQLNPLTIKRKGFSHYITKPLEKSGVELIIAYKEKLKGAGKLNEIKKALFKHFKADEELEKEVASTLSKTNKEADELLKIFEDHDKADDKPQNIIKEEVSKLKDNNIYGKGLKDCSSNIYKNKMTSQEFKQIMTGGALGLHQDLEFRLKNSFKVGELKKMLKELSVENKIEMKPKDISKLNKTEIIDMIVKGNLISVPELPVKVALSKKYKLADLKREVLKHAGLGDFKKADIIKYIEDNNLFDIDKKQNAEEEPKAKKVKKLKKKLIIEEDEEEPLLKESEPSGNPKLQMKGIAVGNKIMPKEVKKSKELSREERVKLLSDRIIIPKDTSLRRKSDAKEFDAPKHARPLELLEELENIDKYIKAYENGEEENVAVDDEEVLDNMSMLGNSYRYEFKLPDRFYTTDVDEKDGNTIFKGSAAFKIPKHLLKKSASKKGKSKSVENKKEDLEDINKEFKIKEYIDKGYNKDDAIEAVERDKKYDKDMSKLLEEGKFIDEANYPDKPLTEKEKGDERESEYFKTKYEKIKGNKKLLEKLQERQPELLKEIEDANIKLPTSILRVMLYENYKLDDLKKAVDFLNKKVRKHEQYKI